MAIKLVGTRLSRASSIVYATPRDSSALPLFSTAFRSAFTLVPVVNRGVAFYRRAPDDQEPIRASSIRDAFLFQGGRVESTSPLLSKPLSHPRTRVNGSTSSPGPPLFPLNAPVARRNWFSLTSSRMDVSRTSEIGERFATASDRSAD